MPCIGKKIAYFMVCFQIFLSAVTDIIRVWVFFMFVFVLCFGFFRVFIILSRVP